MTRQKTFKRRVRDRMAKPGESYTAARRVLIAQGDCPKPPVPRFEPPVSEERVVAATGRGWQAWFEVLDRWEAARRSHTEIARLAQGGSWGRRLVLAVDHRGLRAGAGPAGAGRASGRIRGGRVEDHRCAGGAALRGIRGRGAARALAAGSGAARAHGHAPANRPLRLGGRLDPRHPHFDDLGEAKSRVALSHERLPDAEAADEMKAWWQERLTALKSQLEGG